MSRAWVGTSGYAYDHWKGVFYPEDLPQRERLPHYAARFNALEVNNTFYALPSVDTVKQWVREADQGHPFKFVLKASRYITHTKFLKEPRKTPINRLFSRARHMGDSLAGFLWQLPGGWKCDTEDVERLRGFVEDVAERSEPGWRHAIEFRHETWLREEVFDILARRGFAVVHTDMPCQVLAPGQGARDIPRPVAHAPFTADFVYLRRHGPKGDFGGAYSESQTRTEAEDVRAWLEQGRDVFAFFNNDPEGHAVRDARRLARAVDATPEPS